MTAIDMFRERNMFLVRKDDEYIVYTNSLVVVEFNLNKKTYTSYLSEFLDKSGTDYANYPIGIELNRAIQKQIEELGW